MKNFLKYCNSRKIILISFSAMTVLFLMNKEVFAVTISSSQKISGVEYGSQESFLASLYIWGIGIVGVLAFAQLVRGGIMYMVAGAVDTKSAAKGIITDAFIGLTLALTSYLILNFVNPEISQVKEVELEELKSVEYEEEEEPEGSTDGTVCMDFTTLQNYIDNDYTCDTSESMECEEGKAGYVCIAPTSVPSCSIADSDSAACEAPTQFYMPTYTTGKWYKIGGSDCHPDYYGLDYSAGSQIPSGCELIEYTP